MIKKIWSKLNTQLLTVILTSGLLACLIFYGLYTHRGQFIHYFISFDIISNRSEEVYNSFLKKIKEQKLTLNDTKALTKAMGQDRYQSIYIYRLDDEIVITGTMATILNDFFVGGVFDAGADLYEDNTNSFKREITLLDHQEVVEVGVDVMSFEWARWVWPYIVMTLTFSVIFFLTPVLLFMKIKMKHINELQEEVLNMAGGDLEHQIVQRGNDEIMVLATQLNFLREVLSNNIKQEEEARKANQDLTTALSHDLRTPLTSLKGYLDIVRYNKYENEEQRETYLKNCVEKVNQINELSNKMFEYFLVYSEVEKMDMENILIREINEMIQENIDFLKVKGFKMNAILCESTLSLSVNIQTLRRIFDNLFSNIIKYANHEESIEIICEVKKDAFRIVMSNKKKQNVELIESNEIGLKSVKKMMEIHHGEFFIQDRGEVFICILSFHLEA